LAKLEKLRSMVLAKLEKLRSMVELILKQIWHDIMMRGWASPQLLNFSCKIYLSGPQQVAWGLILPSTPKSLQTPELDSSWWHVSWNSRFQQEGKPLWSEHSGRTLEPTAMHVAHKKPERFPETSIILCTQPWCDPWVWQTDGRTELCQQ